MSLLKGIRQRRGATKKKKLNIPWNAVRALNNKQRKYGTTMTLQKPMKRREQIREAIKRPR